MSNLSKQLSTATSALCRACLGLSTNSKNIKSGFYRSAVVAYCLMCARSSKINSSSCRTAGGQARMQQQVLQAWNTVATTIQGLRAVHVSELQIAELQLVQESLDSALKPAYDASPEIYRECCNTLVHQMKVCIVFVSTGDRCMPCRLSMSAVLRCGTVPPLSHTTPSMLHHTCHTPVDSTPGAIYACEHGRCCSSAKPEATNRPLVNLLPLHDLYCCWLHSCPSYRSLRGSHRPAAAQ